MFEFEEFRPIESFKPELLVSVALPFFELSSIVPLGVSAFYEPATTTGSSKSLSESPVSEMNLRRIARNRLRSM